MKLLKKYKQKKKILKELRKQRNAAILKDNKHEWVTLCMRICKVKKY